MAKIWTKDELVAFLMMNPRDVDGLDRRAQYFFYAPKSVKHSLFTVFDLIGATNFEQLQRDLRTSKSGTPVFNKKSLEYVDQFLSSVGLSRNMHAHPYDPAVSREIITDKGNIVITDALEKISRFADDFIARQNTPSSEKKMAQREALKEFLLSDIDNQTHGIADNDVIEALVGIDQTLNLQLLFSYGSELRKQSEPKKSAPYRALPLSSKHMEMVNAHLSSHGLKLGMFERSALKTKYTKGTANAEELVNEVLDIVLGKLDSEIIKLDTPIEALLSEVAPPLPSSKLSPLIAGLIDPPPPRHALMAALAQGSLAPVVIITPKDDDAVDAVMPGIYEDSHQKPVEAETPAAKVWQRAELIAFLKSEPWDALEFDTRTRNCLYNDNINTVFGLIGKTESELLRIPNFGRKSLNELKPLLQESGLRLGMHDIDALNIHRKDHIEGSNFFDAEIEKVVDGFLGIQAPALTESAPPASLTKYFNTQVDIMWLKSDATVSVTPDRGFNPKPVSIFDQTYVFDTLTSDEFNMSVSVEIAEALSAASKAVNTVIEKALKGEMKTIEKSEYGFPNGFRDWLDRNLEDQKKKYLSPEFIQAVLTSKEVCDGVLVPLCDSLRTKAREALFAPLNNLG